MVSGPVGNRNKETMIMKRNTVIGVSVTCLAMLRGATMQAQTWQTVDDFQYVPGKNSVAKAIAADASQNIFVAGIANDASGVAHGLVMRSADAGATWSTIEDYSYLPGTSSGFYAVGADAVQNVYALGYSIVSGGPHWVVRESGDGGSTWATVDDFHYPNSATVVQAFAGDAGGNVYAAGLANATSGVPHHWLGRTSGNAGQTWATTDDFTYDSSGAFAKAATTTSAGVFVAGYSLSGHWLVRKSTNGGSTWTTVDDFQYSPKVTNLYLNAICADSAGNLYVGSSVPPTKGSGTGYWLIRKGTNGGTSWRTVAEFTKGGQVNAMGVDLKGNLYVAGYDSATSPESWAVVRSPDQGVSWYVSDSFVYQNNSASALSFAADSLGNIYVGGSGGNVAHWLVRKAMP
jgi:hypothetical protein